MSRDKNEVASTERRHGFHHTVKFVSVEPASLLMIVGTAVGSLLFQNLVMETICRVDLGYEEHICKEIVNNVNITFKQEEVEIQKIAAEINTIAEYVPSSILIPFSLFMGPWSDANGRKFPLLLSLCGITGHYVAMLVSYYNLGSLTGLAMTLCVKLVPTLCGAHVTFLMAAYSYIADTSSLKNRTVRTGILGAALRFGNPLGFALSGTLARNGASFETSIILSIVLTLTAIIIVVFRVKNIIPPHNIETNGEQVEGENNSSGCNKHIYSAISKFKECLELLWKNGNDRTVFWLLLVCFFCYSLPLLGEESVMYLFVRERLQWTIGDYGFFSMYNLLMNSIGVTLSIVILIKMFEISDPVVAVIGGISQFAGSGMYAFANTGFMMYMASTMDLFNGTMGVVTRSMLSKTVKPDDVGKLFGLISVMESFEFFVSIPLYAIVYGKTVSTFSGAFFFLTIAITIPAEIIFLYLILRRKSNQTEQSVNETVHLEDTPSA